MNKERRKEKSKLDKKILKLKKLISLKHKRKKLKETLPCNERNISSSVAALPTDSEIAENECMDEVQSSSSSVSMKSSSVLSGGCERCRSQREIVAIDCEFVGCGPKGRINALGRVSIVDINGNVIYDQVALPDRDIEDFRTPWSGLRPKDFIHAIPEEFVKDKVKRLLKNRIVVGHMIKNDFRVLQYSHDPKLVRDTALYVPLRQLGASDPNEKRPMALKKLAKVLLDREIQTAEHDSAEDARASLDLYKLVAPAWEAQLHEAGCHSHKASSPSSDGVDNMDDVSWLDDQFWPEWVCPVSLDR